MHLERAVLPSAEVQGLAEAALLHTDPRSPPSDHQGLLAAYAGAAEWPHRVPQFRACAVGHPRRHRLLHIESVGLRLHGEPDLGAAGLSRRQRHHCAAFSHQHRDVPGHASQVSAPVRPATSPEPTPPAVFTERAPESLGLGLTLSPHFPS